MTINKGSEWRIGCLSKQIHKPQIDAWEWHRIKSRGRQNQIRFEEHSSCTHICCIIQGFYHTQFVWLVNQSERERERRSEEVNRLQELAGSALSSLLLAEALLFSYAHTNWSRYSTTPPPTIPSNRQFIPKLFGQMKPVQQQHCKSECISRYNAIHHAREYDLCTNNNNENKFK